ncbi:hypothetical protein V5O48_018735 [Marasmius crinis-equi]|uniref:No apical meristem-associated C-terminal domain-containing protein n=1 Tax=Marasmius crinis-equi TaxID=585013 RepID=A0ABR3EKG6_9AGAR
MEVQEASKVLESKNRKKGAKKTDETKLPPSTTKKTAPCKAEFKPAAPAKAGSGKKSRMDEFSEIAKAEEATRQEELQMESKKMEGENQEYRVFESVSKMKHEGKMKQFEMKMELKRQELEYKKVKLAGGRVMGTSLSFAMQTLPMTPSGMGGPSEMLSGSLSPSSSSLRLDDGHNFNGYGDNNTDFDSGNSYRTNSVNYNNTG